MYVYVQDLCTCVHGVKLAVCADVPQRDDVDFSMELDSCASSTNCQSNPVQQVCPTHEDLHMYIHKSNEN